MILPNAGCALPGISHSFAHIGHERIDGSILTCEGE